uniref:Protein kinase domain-containing protein n=1 Tax=Gouania willdenowi TaxID=441366 RepID=A0A8C5HA55_GOUWI
IMEGTPLVVGKVLQGNYNAFIILEFIGEGSYGKVAKCKVYGRNAIVAVKIIKQEIKVNVENELLMLEVIGLLNADQAHVVKLYERFLYYGHTCLVFEMLDMDLFQHCLKKGSLCVNDIRPIAKQLLETLQALQSLGVIHADMKPDNVMLINSEYLPNRVKMIDFGMARHSYATRRGDLCQAISYRAPEVTLGLPYTESIDMWGLGCVLAFLYLGFSLFPVHCEHLIMRCIEVDESGSTWRLLTKNELSAIHKTTSFIDLLKKMLRLDGEKRISPTEALQHPFITMSHLSTCLNEYHIGMWTNHMWTIHRTNHMDQPKHQPPGNIVETCIIKEDGNEELQISSSTEKDSEILSETVDLILSFSQMYQLY